MSYSTLIGETFTRETFMDIVNFKPILQSLSGETWS